MNLRNRIGLAFITGLIFYFSSERVFWSFFRTDENILTILLGILLYSVMAYAFLIVVSEFNVKSIWAIFLAGAFFGWLNEGIVAMTLFGSEGLPFPITLSWTALAWHALLSVLILWYLLPKKLIEKNYRDLLLLSIGIGVFWGFWAISWILETPPLAASIPNYFLHGLLFTLILMFAFKSYAQFQPSKFKAGRVEKISLFVIFGLYFSIITVSFVGIFALLIPILFGLLYILLRKNRRTNQDSILTTFDQPIQWKALVLLLLIPVISTIVYLIVYSSGVFLRYNFWILIVSTILGFGLLIISMVKILRSAD